MGIDQTNTALGAICYYQAKILCERLVENPVDSGKLGEMTSLESIIDNVY